MIDDTSHGVRDDRMYRDERTERDDRVGRDESIWVTGRSG